MVLRQLSEWLFPGDGDGETHPTAYTPQQGASGLLVAAAHRDGRYTLVEQDAVTAALMKLFMIGNPEATALRQEADAEVEKSMSFVPFAAAVKGLPKEEQADLIRQLWVVTSVNGETLNEHLLISSVRDFLGFTRAEADALKPVAE
ncbi:TerB family tellurite resistance protein [Parvularcula maris]|uniref:TerB family tellurite resistance protein n=1 Tax=Parvularcula maris TaxID=2965077 RepID=A0A9X2L9Z7_9PROT|nr:TerB family tellurite resistance protein [Parvularcula maris]MCQ8185683.1 TerB family tellurite resistance protein [Parvularcula maris]